MKYSHVLDEVAKLLPPLFHQYYSSNFAKKWSENDGASFLKQDDFGDGYYYDKQRLLIEGGQVEKWDISLLCKILLNSSHGLLIIKKQKVLVQCDKCSNKKYRHQEHSSKTLKFSSPIFDFRKQAPRLECVLIQESNDLRPKIYAVKSCNATEISLKKPLSPKEYTVYLCSDEWAAVQRFRDFRNDFSHLTIHKYSNGDLQEKVEKIKAVYKCLSKDKDTTQIDAIMSGTYSVVVTHNPRQLASFF